MINKCEIPKCNILGVNIAAIDMEWLIGFTNEYIDELSGQYICVSNVHTTVMSYDDFSYRNIQNTAILALPDGGPLASLARKRGYSGTQRTTGPSFMEEVLSNTDRTYKHFFYGSTEETLEKLKTIIKVEFPNASLVGMYSPPFRRLTQEEDVAIVEMICSTNPDFIWVGLGAPKQELWMAEHQNKVNGLMVGVGAGFDYLVGNIKRAPKWMQKCNLEWLYRLMQEPKRLFNRYAITNSKFIWYAVLRRR